MLRALGVLAVSCFAAGCTDTSGVLTTTVVPTLLTVNPVQFLGAVPCGPPGLQSYVVELDDVSDGGSSPSVSIPTMCPNPTSFGSPPVTVGDFYTAAIDGYDRADITPSATGSRKIVDPNGNVVRPRWTTTCGVAPAAADASTSELDAGDAEAAPPAAPAAANTSLFAPTQALLLTEVFLRGCLPLAVVTDTSVPEGGATDETDASAPALDDADSQPANAAADSASSPTGDSADGNAPDGTPGAD